MESDSTRYFLSAGEVRKGAEAIAIYNGGTCFHFYFCRLYADFFKPISSSPGKHTLEVSTEISVHVDIVAAKRCVPCDCQAPSPLCQTGA